MFLRDTGKGLGVLMAIRGDSKTVGDWIDGRVRQRSAADETDVTCSQMTRICGFRNGSFRNNVYGTGMWNNIFTPTLGWYTLHKRCERVLDGNSLEAEISGCWMLIESMKKWVDKCV